MAIIFGSSSPFGYSYVISAEQPGEVINGWVVDQFVYEAWYAVFENEGDTYPKWSVHVDRFADEADALIHAAEAFRLHHAREIEAEEDARQLRLC